MSHQKLKPIDLLLRDNHSVLAGIYTASKQSNRLTDIVRQSLPLSLRAHCLGAIIRNSTLILFADTASWGTHIHYAQHQIRAAVSAARPGQQLRKITVRVLPRAHRPPAVPETTRPRSLSPAARKSIKAAAAAVDDAALAEALQRLARV